MLRTANCVQQTRRVWNGIHTMQRSNNVVGASAYNTSEMDGLADITKRRTAETSRMFCFPIRSCLVRYNNAMQNRPSAHPVVSIISHCPFSNNSCRVPDRNMSPLTCINDNSFASRPFCTSAVLPIYILDDQSEPEHVRVAQEHTGSARYSIAPLISSNWIQVVDSHLSCTDAKGLLI